jgi:hypothetical protein
MFGFGTVLLVYVDILYIHSPSLPFFFGSCFAGYSGLDSEVVVGEIVGNFHPLLADGLGETAAEKS